ncbi:unnamed protein product [[Candida] boidinii]|uniref:Unnamed protein product n=1 Tax=Candida boidinii TaxID=5477 RepID=A0ACB5TQP9_CANBO|nr:unnamed protein product [[Candida] boidinii]GMF06786.1 unnamed protein product [[Candida] boidinii]
MSRRKNTNSSKDLPSFFQRTTNLRSKRLRTTANTTPQGDDINHLWAKTRESVKIAFTNQLKQVNQKIAKPDEMLLTPDEAAQKYEMGLFDLHKKNIDEYKVKFRKDFMAIKNKNTKFAEDILSGLIEPKRLAETPPNELYSAKQKLENSQLREKELKASIGEVLPENINKVKDQTIVSEKWGISGSLAAVDDDFE